MIKCPLSVWWKPEHHFKRFQKHPHAVLSVWWRKCPSCLVYKDNINLYKSVSDFFIRRTAHSNISRVKKVIPGFDLTVHFSFFFSLLISSLIHFSFFFTGPGPTTLTTYDFASFRFAPSKPNGTIHRSISSGYNKSVIVNQRTHRFTFHTPDYFWSIWGFLNVLSCLF